MINLSHRSSDIEIMDDFTQSGEVIKQTLKELERINTLLGGNQVSKNGLKKLLSHVEGTKFHVADLGCGGGDVMMYLSQWANRSGYEINFSGVDANPAIIQYARQNTRSFENIQYYDLNIFSPEFKKLRFDIVHCSLFVHHFTSDELANLFRQLLDQSEVGIVVNDLHRHYISYYFTKWVIRALSKSEMVRYDSVLSIARSFRRKEIISILDQAGITRYSLQWKWAFRWQLVIFK